MLKYPNRSQTNLWWQLTLRYFLLRVPTSLWGYYSKWWSVSVISFSKSIYHTIRIRNDSFWVAGTPQYSTDTTQARPGGKNLTDLCGLLFSLKQVLLDQRHHVSKELLVFQARFRHLKGCKCKEKRIGTSCDQCNDAINMILWSNRTWMVDHEMVWNVGMEWALAQPRPSPRLIQRVW